mmetsp:Transcript_23934/g.46642  ORF Transcript_23934/g.46642 Transcript_23934/m.46642 type:complete len:189 (+) Transcript_23934:1-567(+)
MTLALAGSGIVVAAAMFLAAAAVAGAGSLDVIDFPSSRDLAPVGLVSVAWISLMYMFLYGQSAAVFYTYKNTRAKGESKRLVEGKDGEAAPPSFAAIKYRGKGSRINLAASRTVGNMIEQALPFLLSLWMHAIFVSPDNAAVAGWVWLGFRAIYPLVFLKGLPWLLISTVPGYAVVLYLVGGVIVKMA